MPASNWIQKLCAVASLFALSASGESRAANYADSSMPVVMPNAMLNSTQFINRSMNSTQMRFNPRRFLHGRHLGSYQNRSRSMRTPKRSIAYELDVYTDIGPCIIGSNFMVYWYAGADFPASTPVNITVVSDPTYGVTNATTVAYTYQTTLDAKNFTLNFPVGQLTGYYFVTLTTAFTTSSTLDDFLVLNPGNYGLTVQNAASPWSQGKNYTVAWTVLSDVPASAPVSIYIISDASGDVNDLTQVVQYSQTTTIGAGQITVNLSAKTPVGLYYTYVYSDYASSQVAQFYQVVAASTIVGGASSAEKYGAGLITGLAMLLIAML